MQLNDRYLPAIGMAAVVGIALGVLVANGMRAGDRPSAAYDEPPRTSAAPPSARLAPNGSTAPGGGIHSAERAISGEVVQVEDLGPVRLIGVDARQGPGGKAPNPEISRAILDRLVGGKKVLVSYDPQNAESGFKDEAGLPLVYLALEDGVLVNMELVARGGAVAVVDEPYAHRDDLIKAERDARWSSRGLWEVAAVKAVPMPPQPGLPGVTRPVPGTIVEPPKAIPNDAVLVTSDGRFHRQSCKFGKGGIPMSIEDARAKHYLADPQCFVSPKVKI